IVACKRKCFSLSRRQLLCKRGEEWIEGMLHSAALTALQDNKKGFVCISIIKAKSIRVQIQCMLKDHLPPLLSQSFDHQACSEADVADVLGRSDSPRVRKKLSGRVGDLLESELLVADLKLCRILDVCVHLSSHNTCSTSPSLTLSSANISVEPPQQTSRHLDSIFLRCFLQRKVLFSMMTWFQEFRMKPLAAIFSKSWTMASNTWSFEGESLLEEFEPGHIPDSDG
ncbi:hypothetical protein L9F63_008082, partial [Diploptera punctata]